MRFGKYMDTLGGHRRSFLIKCFGKSMGTQGGHRGSCLCGIGAAHFRILSM